jgi:hypothetical protein
MKFSAGAMRAGVRGLLIWSAILASGVFALAMLAITISLAAKLTLDERLIAGFSREPLNAQRGLQQSAAMAAQQDAAVATQLSNSRAPLQFAPTGASNPVTTATAPRAAAAAPPKSDEGDSSAVANAMTAVGTAIAAVTLIISVGSTWFAMKLKEVESVTANLTRAQTQYVEQLASLAAEKQNYMEAQQRFIAAKLALRKWVDQHAVGPARYSLLTVLTANLEVLMLASPQERHHSFGELVKNLPDRAGRALLEVESYANFCHQLHGGSKQTYGLWCAIFDPVERAAYAASLPAQNVMY